MSWLGDVGSAVLGTLYAERVAVAILAGGSFLALGVIAWRRRWFGAARRHPGRSAVVLLPVLAFALPTGWYLGSPLVLSSTIDEPAPVAVASPTPPATAPPEASVRSTSPSLTPSPSGPGTPSRPPIALSYAGTFHGSDEFHFGRGTARLIQTEPRRLVVRLEDFAVRNGPISTCTCRRTRRGTPPARSSSAA